MNLSDIQHGTVNRPPRVIIAGVEKIGKTTWAASFPDPIFLIVKGEEGADALDVAKFPVSNSFEEVISALEVLATEDHQFKTVVIDSLSTLEPLIWESLCKNANVESIEKVGGGFGKGYVEAVSNWRDIMALLDYLRNEKGMGCVLIAHVAIKSFADPSGDNYDCYELDINKKAVSALTRWSDAILFANCKVYTKTVKDGMKESKKGVMKQGGERVLFTQKRPAHPGGGRGVLGQLPYELELSYEAWINAIETAKGSAI